MTAAGWVFLIASWAAILWVTIFCFARLLRPKRPLEERHDPAGQVV